MSYEAVDNFFEYTETDLDAFACELDAYRMTLETESEED